MLRKSNKVDTPTDPSIITPVMNEMSVNKMYQYLEGEKISGMYMMEFPFTGVVVESRVAYGGRMKHTVELDEPIMVYGAVRSTIIVEGNEIQ